MLKGSLVAKVLPGLAVSGVLIASFVASPLGLFGSLSGYGYGVCGYGYNAFGGTATVTGLSPTSGTTAGGTSVFITGSGFCNTVSAVTFGTPAQSINVLADTLIQAVTPAHAAGPVDVRVTNAAGTSAISSADVYTFTNPTPSVYTALSPQRILDTRTNSGTLGPGGSVNLSIGGIYVPANATSVVLNVTSVDGSTAGFFTLYPTGGTTPTASNLNWVAGETVPNLVSVGLSSGGDVTIFNGLGSADVVVDLEGYFAPASGGSTSGQFVPLPPTRITDTRAGSGQANAGSTLAAGTTLNVQVAGKGGVPLSGFSAVVLNVTAVDQTKNGFFTVFPKGNALPLASNLNWTPGDTVPNRVIVPLDPGIGQVSIYNGLGSADAVVDVNGYFTDSSASGAGFFTLFPARIVDTRNGTGGFPIAPLGAGATMTVTVDGHGGVPATLVKAVIINVTVANPTTASDLVIWPHGTTQPTASDLNFVGGQTVPNLVVVQVSALGQIDIFNAFGTTNVIVDVVGYYT
jgi:IPT/TIG domain-containing protein